MEEMGIKLKHKNKVIGNKVIIFKNFFMKSLGLRFSKELKEKEALVLVNKNASKFNSIIDMFFVFYPIDILWVDDNGEVLDVKRCVKPNAIKIPRKPANFIIEMRKFSTKNIKIGDKLDIKEIKENLRR